MKNKIKILIFLFVIVSQLIFTVNIFAQENYTLLAPIPCVGSDNDCNKLPQTTTLEKYLPGVFKLAIGLSAVFTVFMIVLGGFQYMTSDAIMGKKDGMNRVKNSVWGLVLVIAAWLILNEINPKLTEINLNVYRDWETFF